MQSFAVICEFNPFHNGHKYLLDNMRAQGGECIVAVMSGSFTQRGDVAVYPKHQRAKDAILGGADVVIELPAVWAVSSAQRFAKGGCDIIKALGCIDKVYFGSECGDINLLKSALEATENKIVNKRLRELMDKGEYYPAALEQAVSEICGAKIAEIIKNPNNTLGIEYMRSLSGSGIDVCTVKRTGVMHDSDEVSQCFASASKIRELIAGSKNFGDYLPPTNSENPNPALAQYGERAVIHKLRSLSADDIAILPDVTEGLENRIVEAARKHGTTEDILNHIKTKRYTHARLRRILTCAMLGITKAHQCTDVPYVRILGFNSRGEQFIKEVKSTCKLPVIINVASAYKELDASEKEIFDIDVRATDIRTVFEKTPTECGADFTTPVVKINLQ